MWRTARVLPVTCVITCLTAIPWNNALASERQDSTPSESRSQPLDDLTRGDGQLAPEGATKGVREASLVLGGVFTVSDAERSHLLTRTSQSVASTNEPKLLLGVIAGALIVTGVAMLAYGTTSSCKGSHPTDNTCDRNTVLGAIGLSGGTVMLVVWALSK